MINRVEISRSALQHNLAEFRKRIGDGPKLGAVVKANAYGHGMTETAAIAVEHGADWLCVNSLGEGVQLRDAGFECPVLVMGFVPPTEMASVVAHGLRPVVYDPAVLEALEQAADRKGVSAPFHLKVETGTNRQGVREEDLPAFTERIKNGSRIELEGIYTHFANIEDTTDHTFAEDQMETFRRIGAAVERDLGTPIPMRHSACSAATLLFDRTHMDMVRVGISMYGLWPSSETFVSCRERGVAAPDLRPVMAWKTGIAQVKSVSEGEYIGYGCTYRATRSSRIAVLPVGYSEGYDRRLSGVGHVLVQGRRAPIRGRVCMNMCMVDVTDIENVSVGTDVVLLGEQGDESIRAEQLARWCGTISYEIVSRISPEIPRAVVED